VATCQQVTLAPKPDTFSPKKGNRIGRFTIYLGPGIGHKLTCYAPAWERRIFPSPHHKCIFGLHLAVRLYPSSIFGIQTTIGGKDVRCNYRIKDTCLQLPFDSLNSLHLALRPLFDLLLSRVRVSLDLIITIVV